ncbi:hypothetical protein EB796_016993 [Bugula neritina]|uniref:Uncharacterized protein n=1 Tax=Bugula neritina TaxID=10212 RepID=A0A7J7JEG7_BUGNE|nr:hypothetical protein EB796_016993 [Bugula neritina]
MMIGAQFARTRAVCDLLEPIASGLRGSEFKFDATIFCPILISSEDNTDSNDRRIVPELQLSEIRSHKDTWIHLLSNPSTTTHKSHDSTHKSHGPIYKSHDSINKSHDPVVHLFPSLKSAIQWLSRDPDYRLSECSTGVITPELVDADVHLQVFITGSLYLVGNSFFYLKEKF